MAMFPIFIIGLLTGCLLGYSICNAIHVTKESTPSEVKLKLLEAKVIQLKSDNELLEKYIYKKDDIIKQLQADIHAYETSKNEELK